MAKKFDWTEETDPARDVPWRGKSVPRERALTDEELDVVYHACDQVIGLPFGAAFQIALLTGQRMGEVCGLPWSEIDFASKAWSLPAERAKNRQAHRIHLSEPVLAILDRIRRHDYYDKKFVFPRQDGLGSVVYWTGAHRKLVKHLDSTIGPRERWTPHDLRRTMATGMAELGVDDKYIEMALNHEPLSPLARTYNKAKYWPQQADAHNLWGAHVAKLVHALDVASDERQP